MVALDRLTQRAIKVKTERNRSEEQRHQIPWFHHFYAPVRIGSDEYAVRLVVREFQGGQRFYHRVVFQKENARSGSEPIYESGAYTKPSEFEVASDRSRSGRGGDTCVYRITS